MEIRPPRMRLSRRLFWESCDDLMGRTTVPRQMRRDGAEVSAHPRAQVDALARIFLLESEAGRMELSSSDCPSLQCVCEISSLDPVGDSHLRSERCRRPAHVNQALADCGESALQDRLGPSHRKGGFQRACGTQTQFGKNLIVCRLLDKTRVQSEHVGEGGRKSVS